MSAFISYPCHLLFIASPNVWWAVVLKIKIEPMLRRRKMPKMMKLI